MQNNHELEEQLSAIDEDLSDAVMSGNEKLIGRLQQQRMKIENILLGNDTLA